MNKVDPLQKADGLLPLATQWPCGPQSTPWQTAGVGMRQSGPS